MLDVRSGYEQHRDHGHEHPVVSGGSGAFVLLVSVGKGGGRGETAAAARRLYTLRIAAGICIVILVDVVGIGSIRVGVRNVTLFTHHLASWTWLRLIGARSGRLCPRSRSRSNTRYPNWSLSRKSYPYERGLLLASSPVDDWRWRRGRGGGGGGGGG